MVACTLFFFYTVQSAPSFAFVVRYIFDVVLLYTADCLRSKLVSRWRCGRDVRCVALMWPCLGLVGPQMPSWFAAQQFS